MNDPEMCVYINYSNLHQFIQAFQKSVALFELLERGGGPPSTGVFGGVFIQYRIIAARDGALSTSSVASIRRSLWLCLAWETPVIDSLPWEGV
jgi:hypothetical protein